MSQSLISNMCESGCYSQQIKHFRQKISDNVIKYYIYTRHKLCNKYKYVSSKYAKLYRVGSCIYNSRHNTIDAGICMHKSAFVDMQYDL